MGADWPEDSSQRPAFIGVESPGALLTCRESFPICICWKRVATLLSAIEEPAAISGTVTALRHVDPMRAHGAWIYLFASIASGTLVGTQHAVEIAMLVGTGFAGAYLVTAALTAGVRRRMRQVVLGGSLVVLAPLSALGLGAEPGFVVVAGCAVIPAVAAVVLTTRLGSLARLSLLAGVAAVVMAAPVTAVAGGASFQRAGLLFALLWFFFSWRTLRVAARVKAQETWDRQQLKAQGLREAAIAAVWTLAVTLVLRIF
jgi:hypothetical protein